jgi:hypothetical protein
MNQTAARWQMWLSRYLTKNARLCPVDPPIIYLMELNYMYGRMILTSISFGTENA